MTHYLKVKCKNNEHVPCLLLVSPTDSPAQSQKLTGLNAETQTVLYCLFIKHYFKQQSVDQSAVKFYKPHTKTIPTIKDRNNNLQITKKKKMKPLMCNTQPVMITLPRHMRMRGNIILTCA